MDQFRRLPCPPALRKPRSSLLTNNGTQGTKKRAGCHTVVLPPGSPLAKRSWGPPAALIYCPPSQYGTQEGPLGYVSLYLESSCYYRRHHFLWLSVGLDEQLIVKHIAKLSGRLTNEFLTLYLFPSSLAGSFGVVRTTFDMASATRTTISHHGFKTAMQ
ncbi:hypothetical protein LY78DRAFT_122362 [Colletotrichum sublineola]|nr:hypothetical protein LY78DRAFT_122362 [Colletotrichum sublineola]